MYCRQSAERIATVSNYATISNPVETWLPNVLLRIHAGPPQTVQVLAGPDDSYLRPGFAGRIYGLPRVPGDYRCDLVLDVSYGLIEPRYTATVTERVR